MLLHFLSPELMVLRLPGLKNETFGQMPNMSSRFLPVGMGFNYCTSLPQIDVEHYYHMIKL